MLSTIKRSKDDTRKRRATGVPRLESVLVQDVTIIIYIFSISPEHQSRIRSGCMCSCAKRESLKKSASGDAWPASAAGLRATATGLLLSPLPTFMLKHRPCSRGWPRAKAVDAGPGFAEMRSGACHRGREAREVRRLSSFGRFVGCLETSILSSRRSGSIPEKVYFADSQQSCVSGIGGRVEGVRV